MTERLSDAEIEALKRWAAWRDTDYDDGRNLGEMLSRLIVAYCATEAELKQWHAQFGADPSRWHKVWEVGKEFDPEKWERETARVLREKMRPDR